MTLRPARVILIPGMLALLILSLAPTDARASELEEIKRARSIIAESALTIQLLLEARIPSVFAEGLLEDAGEQLGSATEGGRLAPEMIAELKSAQSAIAARDAASLNQIVERLHQLERQHE
jgi:hypothetical protein